MFARKHLATPNCHQTSDRSIHFEGDYRRFNRKWFECHGRPVRETIATGKCISTEKARIQVQFINKLRVLNLENYTSSETENVSCGKKGHQNR
jgi:hypothetical protein